MMGTTKNPLPFPYTVNSWTPAVDWTPPVCNTLPFSSGRAPQRSPDKTGKCVKEKELIPYCTAGNTSTVCKCLGLSYEHTAVQYQQDSINRCASYSTEL